MKRAEGERETFQIKAKKLIKEGEFAKAKLKEVE